jgi:hypothetical protein
MGNKVGRCCFVSAFRCKQMWSYSNTGILHLAIILLLMTRFTIIHLLMHT